MAGPLSGIRVLDITTVLMGPYATQLLADMGADVIKLEPPGGDTTRHIGVGRHPDMGANFLHMNRGKRSIVIDLKSDEGGNLARRLSRRADVLVHNIRAGAIQRLGLDYPTVRQDNQTLIYCHLLGYSEAGSRAGEPAYDDLIQGASGLSWLIGQSTGTPGYVPTAMADRSAGMFAAFAICAALFERAATGKGRDLSVAMYDVLAHLVLSDHMGGATFIPPEGPVGYRRLYSDRRHPYPTADGHICLLIYTDAHWRRFFTLIERPDLAGDPRFRDMRSRNNYLEELNRVVTEALASRGSAEWLRLLAEADLPAGPVRSILDLIADPDLRASGTLADAVHPQEGSVHVLTAPVTGFALDRDNNRCAPRAGEHSRSILAELGLTATEIDRLTSSGVVQTAPDTE